MNDQKKMHLGLRINEELKDRLRRASEKEQRSVSQVVVMAIEKFLKDRK